MKKIISLAVITALSLGFNGCDEKANENINFVKSQHFDSCPNANIGTVIDNYIDSYWSSTTNENGITLVSVKGEVSFMNTNQDVIFEFQSNIKNNTFKFNKMSINDKDDDNFFTQGLIENMCKESHGEERVEDELAKIKSTKSQNISNYLLKYSDEKQFSDKERLEFYSKYTNQYVELPMTIFSIEKIDVNIYKIQGSIEKRGKTLSVFATVYTSNNKEVDYLKKYKTGENDMFSTQKTVLFKGKFKVDNDMFLSTNLKPAIIVLK